MINKLAQKLTNHYIGKKDIEKDETEKYNYCFEILLATILNVLCLLGIGVIFNRLLETLIYLIVFAVLRSQTGGYHAKTHFCCILISIINCLIMYCVLECVGDTILRSFTYISVPFCLIVISLLAPIESENKHLDELTKRKGAILSKIIIVCLTVLIVLAIIIKNYQIEFVLDFSIFSITVSIVVGYINNIKRRNIYD